MFTFYCVVKYLLILQYQNYCYAYVAQPYCQLSVSLFTTKEPFIIVQLQHVHSSLLGYSKYTIKLAIYTYAYNTLKLIKLIA